jgi:hypothetical protein
MTLLATQHNKLGGTMGDFLHNTFEPALYNLMKIKGYDLVPYVNHFGSTPDSGWTAFADGPRYSSGYTTLFHTFGFVPETHMLKPYPQRVKATYALMECFIKFTSEHSEEIKRLREAAKQAVRTQERFPLSWNVDRSVHDSIVFRGYTAGYKPSAISGQPRLYYDRSAPYVKKVKFLNTYTAENFVKKPVAYVIPQGWWAVIDRLKNNQVQYVTLEKDTTIEVEVYKITDYQSYNQPFEKHYLHTNVKVSSSKDSIRFRKGDVYIPMNQTANRYLMEVLEPTAPDSYFAWNFFDAILGQKEGYSPYVFEDTGAEWLSHHPEVKQRLEQKKAADSAFAKSGSAQLEFIFMNSPYAEPEYRRYPVYRVL